MNILRIASLAVLNPLDENYDKVVATLFLKHSSSANTASGKEAKDPEFKTSLYLQKQKQNYQTFR